MSLASNLRVPELVAGVDVRSLPLSALEGFVLSRIDGRSSAGDIVSMTGLPLEQVVGILDKLVQLGAARYHDEPAFDPLSGSSQRQPPSPHPNPASQHARRRVSHAPPQRRMLSEAGFSSPPPEVPQGSTRPRKLSELPPQRTPSGAPETRRRESAVQPALPAPQLSSPPSAASTTSSSRGPSEAGPPLSSVAGGSGASTGVLNGLSSIEPSPLPAAGVRYDPSELEEPVDLPMERRKQVLDLFYQLADLDYYEALGVSYEADKKEIRAAYFALSKQFHPDTLFRKNLGSFKPKMVAVFKYLTEGYEILGKKKSRDEYDAYLRSTKAAQMAERALKFEPARPASAHVQVPPPPPVPQVPAELLSGGSEHPTAQRQVSPEARRLAQEVLARRLRGLAVPPPRPAIPNVDDRPEPRTMAPSVAAPGPASPKPDTQSVLANLARTLRDAGNLTGSNDRVTRAVRASQAAVERGDLAEATQQAARAASLAPERTELKSEHARLSAMLSERLANDYIAQARFEMKQGKWASAALTWAKVCEGRPQDAAAHRHAAQSLLKGGGEMRSAQKYAQKAVFLAPNDIEARILLAQIYLTVGLKLNARRELDAAAKLDPANEMVKNLLTDLEKG